MMAAPHRIDVHHHVTPPSFIAASRASAFANAPRQLWTIEQSLEDMDRGGVATAIISLPHPVRIWPGDRDEARRLARDWNEVSTTLARQHPGRFGLFATLPILDLDGSLREIEYALDTLHADGINLMTNIGDKWLGDPYFAPLFEELNRRKAVVYTHPIAPDCCRGLIPGINDAVVEFATDTTRAIVRLLFSGAAERYPDIAFIFSHAGGTVPFLAERLTRIPETEPGAAAAVPKGVSHYLQRFHYDIAQAAHPGALAALTRLVAVSQILFGTDFPFRTAADHVTMLEAYGFSAADLRAIDCANAQRLLPRWRSV
jgi:6-methylsalicylate decarboxylase